MVTFETLWNVLAAAFICALVLSYIEITGRWKLFEKAGASGWKAAVPVLSSYTLYKLVWTRAMFAVHLILVIVTVLLLLMKWPFRCIGLLLMVGVMAVNGMVSMRIAKCFGKGTGYGICLIFLHPIFMPIIGWSYDRYMGNI